jgi:hypothetical protein
MKVLVSESLLSEATSKYVKKVIDPALMTWQEFHDNIINPQDVWNADSDPFSNTVEAHILNLRKKIHTEGEPDIIKNIPGRGYIIEI